VDSGNTTQPKYQDSWHVELLPAAGRALLRAGDRPGDAALRQLVLSYQSDLLERPLAEVLRERDEGQSRLRAVGTPSLTLHACPQDDARRPGTRTCHKGSLKVANR
jgi:hypothetical protein